MCLKPQKTSCRRKDSENPNARRPRLNRPSCSISAGVIRKDVFTLSIRQILKSSHGHYSAPDVPIQNTCPDLQPNLLTTNEQYRHPLWHQKCLSVLERDKHQCRACGAAEVHLQVYLLNLKPKGYIWEEDEDCLRTVCDSCRDRLDYEILKLAGILAFGILAGEIDPLTFIQLP